MTKLPKKFKKEWVKALVSGKFPQGRYNLYNKANNTFCCLGVACDLAGVSRDIYEKNCYPNTTSNPAYLVLPEILRSYDQGVMIDLSELNDDGVPFEVIAGFINENL